MPATVVMTPVAASILDDVATPVGDVHIAGAIDGHPLGS